MAAKLTGAIDELSMCWVVLLISNNEGKEGYCLSSA